MIGHNYAVRVKSGVSESDIITTGVPQGTVLGPLLFNAYIAPLTTLLKKHNIRHHLYADDTQLYITFPPTGHTQALARMEACVQDAKAWLCDNGLVMNNNKSQAIVIHSSSLRTPCNLVNPRQHMWPARRNFPRYTGSRIQRRRKPNNDVTSGQRVSLRLLPSITNRQDTRLHQYHCM